MIDKVDLLVHIGASSTRHDDERYRAQAKAYLEFRGDVVNSDVLNGIPLNGSEALHELIVEADPTDVVDGTYVAAQDEPSAFLDDTQLAYNALDSQLVTSSLRFPSQVTIRTASQQSSSSQGLVGERNRNNKLRKESAKKHLTNQARSGKERSSSNDAAPLEDSESSGNGNHPVEISPEALPDAMSTPRKVPHTHPLSQSSYLKSPILDKARPPKKKQRLDSVGGSHGLLASPRIHVSFSHPRYVALPEQTGTGLAYIGDRAVTSVEEHINDENDGGNGREHHSYETTSELPTSYSLSDITSESSRARNKANFSQRSGSDPGPGAGDAKGAVKAPTSTAANVQRPVEVMEVQVQPEPTIASPRRIATAISPQEKQNTYKVNSPSSNNLSTAKPTLPQAEASPHSPPPILSKTISPPSPKAGHDPHSSHLTSTLLQLASDTRIKDSYRPLSTARPIRDLERGYWLIDTTSWPDQARTEFWKYLERSVGGGYVGWGVWCCRGEAEADAEAHQDDGDGYSRKVGEGEPGGGEDMVKVFCWGEVVKEIYLLLYVASKSRVRKAGLRWVDGRGEVVVRMREG